MYYIKEGWYELVNNWDDYMSIKVNDGEIAIWRYMPKLPEYLK